MQDESLDCYRRYLQGEGKALEELVMRLSDALVRYCFCFVRDTSSAEDIAEDSFVALITRRKTFPDEGKLRAYLYKIARNKCIDYIRRRSRETAFPAHFERDLEDVEKTILEEEKRRILYARLQELHADYKDALYLTYFEGFSAEELSGILKKSKKQVYNLLARGKAALKVKLEQDGIFS